MAGGSREPGRTVTSKVLAILEAFEKSRGSLSLTDIAERSGLPLSTVHRLVNELADWGFLSRDPHGRYQLGMRLWELAQNTGRQLRDAARPYIQDLFSLTGETAHLAGYWTFTLAMSWGPAYFQNVLGFSGQQAGTMIALPAAWGTIATVGLSALTQRLHLKGVPTRKARGWVLGGAGTFAGACLVGATLTTSPVLSITLMVFGFGTAPALFAITYLVVAELTTISQRGANLSIANAVLTTGGVFAPAVSGFLIGGAATPADGYRSAFALAGGLMLTFSVLALLFVNQQRDRRRLGLDTAGATAPLASTPAASNSATEIEPTPVQASTRA